MATTPCALATLPEEPISRSAAPNRVVRLLTVAGEAIAALMLIAGGAVLAGLATLL